VLNKDIDTVDHVFAVADLGKRPGGAARPPLSLFWVKKEEMTGGRKAGRASKTPPLPAAST